MKLWDKGYTIHDLVERFTVGEDRILDVALARYDVQGSMAHAKMLHHIGILTQAECDTLLAGLTDIQEAIEKGDFVIEDTFEDVHSKIEFELTQKLGDVGQKLHTARSRNDQILVDLHLYAKAEIITIKKLIKVLFETLMTLSAQHQEVLMPGYTHLQIAMPSSFGLWFSAYAESLIDDLIVLNAAYQISDQNPLGSAAGYGSSFPIDRQMTTELLGFATLKYNAIAAQLTRGKLEKLLAFAIASVAGTLNKFATDMCLYMSQNFNFIQFPKELTTGSSIMPHKQNPDVFELIRAKCNKLQVLPTEIMLMTSNLPSGYHRDFQELKAGIVGGVAVLKDCLRVMTFMLQHIIVNPNILDDLMYDPVYSVEEVNKRVMAGMTFRAAYQQVAQDLQTGHFKPDKHIHHTHLGSLGNLGLAEIQKKFEQHYA